ncbi:conserved hypothetical protein [Stenotrophomonas geniculata]|nr:hypothetical protein BN1263190001 [Stenotrophomonas maltophilia]
MSLREIVCWSRGMTRRLNGDVAEEMMLALPVEVSGLPNGIEVHILALLPRQRHSYAPFV